MDSPHILLSATNRKAFVLDKSQILDGHFFVTPIPAKFTEQQLCQPDPDFGATADTVVFDLSILPNEVTNRLGWHLIVGILRTGDLSLALSTACLTKGVLRCAYRTFIRHALPEEYGDKTVQHLYSSLSRTFRILEIMVDEIWTEPVVQTDRQTCSYIGFCDMVQTHHPLPYMLDPDDLGMFTALTTTLKDERQRKLITGCVHVRMCDQLAVAGKVCTGGDLIHCKELIYPWMVIRCMTTEQRTIQLAKTDDAREVWHRFAGLVNLVAEGCQLYAIDHFLQYALTDLDIFVRKL
jgi:hypothetical protein